MNPQRMELLFDLFARLEASLQDTGNQVAALKSENARLNQLLTDETLSLARCRQEKEELAAILNGPPPEEIAATRHEGAIAAIRDRRRGRPRRSDA